MVDSVSKINIFNWRALLFSLSANLCKDEHIYTGKLKLPPIENVRYKYFCKVTCGLPCSLINTLIGKEVNIRIRIFDYGWCLVEGTCAYIVK